MFGTLSMAGELLLAPTNLLVIIVGLGLLMSLARRLAVIGCGLIAAAALTLAVLAAFPIGDWILAPLESRFPPFVADDRPVAGIIVLGGSLGGAVVGNEDRATPSQAIDRLFVTAELARRFPAARVLVSGGPVNAYRHTSEADFVAGYLGALGVSADRILRERRSADTFENAGFSAAVVHPRPDQRWLLVTSAAHMPRAMACFRAAGFTVTAAPADWRRARRYDFIGSSRWSASTNLAKVDLAWKEYLGLAAYRLVGRTSEWFPGPGAAVKA